MSEKIDPAELELARSMYKVALAERDLERHRNIVRRLRAEVLERDWEEEIKLRTSTRQDAQAALLRDCVKELKKLFEERT